MHLLLSLSRSNCRHIQLVSLLHTLLGMNTVQTCPFVTPSFWYRGAMYGELWGISLISCGIWGLIQRIFLRLFCIQYVNYGLYQLYQPYRLNENISAVSTGSTESIISPVNNLIDYVNPAGSNNRADLSLTVVNSENIFGSESSRPLPILGS